MVERDKVRGVFVYHLVVPPDSAKIAGLKDFFSGLSSSDSEIVELAAGDLASLTESMLIPYSYYLIEVMKQLREGRYPQVRKRLMIALCNMLRNYRRKGHGQYAVYIH